MPVGPVEMGDMHFAPNRLGYTTWVTRVWSKDLEPEFIVVITRILEKSAKFALVLKEWLLQYLKDRGDLHEWQAVVNWSD